MADNNVKKDLVQSVRDDIQPNPIGHHYADRVKFINCHECRNRVLYRAWNIGGYFEKA